MHSTIARSSCNSAEATHLGEMASRSPALHSTAAAAVACTRKHGKGRTAMCVICRECGAKFQAKRTTRAFCAEKCRRSFNNRRRLQGADFYDLIMAMRYDRADAKETGVWSLLCRMAANFKAADERERGGRRSWDGMRKVLERNPHLSATLVGVNVAGRRATRGGQK